jgi:4-hydroxy-tetrahydrodipicolinate synthase
MPVEGVLPVIPTPFRDGTFDRESFERFLDHMLAGVDGFTLLGSTGEAPSLTTAERQRIAADVLELTPGDKTVVVGITHTSIGDAVELARHAQAHGAAAVLCASPFYFANTSEGILRYLERIDRVIDVDLVLYDNPAATKTTLDAGDVVRWSQELEHLRSVKLTDHDLRKVAIWHDAGLKVLAGDDPILFRYLAAGVDGAMVIAPCIFPDAFRETWARVRNGDLAGAQAVFSTEIAPLLHVFGIGDEIATTKALLADLGIFASDELLPPLQPVSGGRRLLLRTAYDLGREHSASRRAQEAAGV